jgi:acetyl/propionyl-CoA carboxylase alpha subunit
VYAEDPYAGFLPQAGHVLDAAWPDRARVETDLGADQDVSTAYDPMLGKIVVAGADREQARRRMLDALDDTGIFGVTTNLGFVRRLVASEEFAAGDVHTAWLDSEASVDLLTPPSLSPEAARAAALLWASFTVSDGGSPWSLSDGWRAGADPAPTRIVLVDESGTSWEFGLSDDDAVPDGMLAIADADGLTIAWQGQTWRLEAPDPMRGGHQTGAATDADIVAPMPGTVLRVDVAEGESVTLGQQLGVVEAMKMELAMLAPYDGTVSHVGATAGDQVPIKHLLFRVEPAKEDG